MNNTFFPTLGPQQPCVFCFCEENTKHYGVAKLKFGNTADIHACSACEAELWKEHENTVGNYTVNFTPTQDWWGSKKMRLDHCSAQMLMRKRCEAFYEFVVAKYKKILERRQFTAYGPMGKDVYLHADREGCPYKR